MKGLVTFLARAGISLLPLAVFMAGIRLSGFDGEVLWQMPAVDVTVVLIDRDGPGGRCGRPGAAGADL